MQTYASKTGCNVLDYEVSYVGNSKKFITQLQFRKEEARSTMENFAKTFVANDLSLPENRLNATVDNVTKEIIVSAKKNDSVFFCPACEDLKRELFTLKQRALIRQSAINVEMVLKVIALDFVSPEKKEEFFVDEIVRDLPIRALDTVKLCHLSFGALLYHVYMYGKANEYHTKLGMKNRVELDSLRDSLKEMKELFNGDAHPTGSIIQAGNPITFDECKELISNCDAISDKSVVIKSIELVRNKRAEGEPFLQSYNY